MWDDDEEFVAWLDSEQLGTDLNPLDDDILELMHQAWQAGQENASKVVVSDHFETVNL